MTAATLPISALCLLLLSGFPAAKRALNLRFEQSSEQVQRRCLTNMSYQHLWRFYKALTYRQTHTPSNTPTHTHTKLGNLVEL